MASTSSRIHRGFWFLRLFLMCASLVGVLLAIEHLNKSRISFEPLTGTPSSLRMEEGITATVRRDSRGLPSKAAAEAQRVDNTPASH